MELKYNTTKPAILLDIQRGSRKDGPGLRTTIFLKGCALRCAWCHNPESQSLTPQLMYNKERCILCGNCSAVCPNGVHILRDSIHSVAYEKCKVCNQCHAVCPTEALSIQGFSKTVEDLMRIIQKDLIFYQHTGGGITLSGGEPFLHKEFCHDLLARCQEENIHSCVETSGHAPAEAFHKLALLTDLFLFDFKVTGKEKTLKWVGTDGNLIASNFDFILKQRKKVILRCPIIPGVNNNTEHFNAISEIVSNNSSIIRAELLPYHNFGIVKGENIGLSSGTVFRLPDEEEKEQWMEYLKARLGEKICWG